MRRTTRGRSRTPSARPARTREHYIADLSINYIERFVLLQGHTVGGKRYDYGYDLVMDTYDYKGNTHFNTGEYERGNILLQLKATDNLNVLKDGETISFSISHKHVELWREETMPVILIVYDVVAEVAYWLYTQRYFKAPGFHIPPQQQEITVHIPKSNVVNAEAIETFRRYKREVLTRVAKVENLHG